MIIHKLDSTGVPCFPATWTNPVDGKTYSGSALEKMSSRELLDLGWYIVTEDYPEVSAGDTVEYLDVVFQRGRAVQQYAITKHVPYAHPKKQNLSSDIPTDVIRMRQVAISAFESAGISADTLSYLYTVYSLNQLTDIAHVFALPDSRKMIKVAIPQESAENTYYQKDSSDSAVRWRSISLSDPAFVVDVYTEHTNGVVKDNGVITSSASRDPIPEGSIPDSFHYKDNIFAWSVKADDTVLEYYKYRM